MGFLDRQGSVLARLRPHCKFIFFIPFGISTCVFSVIKPDLQEPAALFDVRMTPKEKKGGETPFGLPVYKWFSELDDLNTVGVSPATQTQPQPPHA